MFSAGRAERRAAEKQARGLDREAVMRRRGLKRNRRPHRARAFRSSSGWDSSDIETSYCGSGGALSASCKFRIERARDRRDGAASAVLAPRTDALDVEGSSFAGAASAGAAGSGGGA